MRSFLLILTVIFISYDLTHIHANLDHPGVGRLAELSGDLHEPSPAHSVVEINDPNHTPNTPLVAPSDQVMLDSLHVDHHEISIKPIDAGTTETEGKNQKEKTLTDTDCSICLSNLDPSDTLAIFTLKCTHSHHTDCLRPWLRIRPTCPKCRALITPSEFATLVPGGLYPQGLVPEGLVPHALVPEVSVARYTQSLGETVATIAAEYKFFIIQMLCLWIVVGIGLGFLFHSI